MVRREHISLFIDEMEKGKNVKKLQIEWMIQKSSKSNQVRLH